MAEFTMPSLGADMEAGILVEWKVRPGDVVRRGDIVAVVDTDKGAIDVEIFEAGRIESLLVQPGERVPVGTVLARIAAAAQAHGPAAPSATAPPVPEKPAAPPPAQERVIPAAAAPAGAVPPSRPRASPAAKLRALELGVQLEQLKGTGPGGAITREDVERGARPLTIPKAARPARPAMRHAIAAAMARSKREIPHYYLATRIDVSPALEWLKEHNAALEPVRRVLPIALWLKAVALAAHAVPEVNGFYENGEFRPGSGVHVGVAVALREGGLLVPALHDVDRKSIAALSSELADVIERARRGQLKSSELSDATLTVTSLGERGVEEVFGVIFPPQVALVGFGTVTETALVVGGQCVPRHTVQASLAADHRVSDGHRGGLFLARVSALLQHPESL